MAKKGTPTLPWDALGLGRFVAVAGGREALFAGGAFVASADAPPADAVRVVYGSAGDAAPTRLDLALLYRCLFPCEPSHDLTSACRARGVALREDDAAVAVGELLVAVLQEAAPLDRVMLQLVGSLCGGAVHDVLQALVTLSFGAPATENLAEEPQKAERAGPAMGSAREVLGPAGPIATSFPGYEARRGQLDMARVVEETLAEGGAASVEAGPGTGKTFAYLVPALARLEAEDGARIVVCTRTKQLQDQIFHKDLPFLLARTGARASIALLKGRDNYLCLRRWEALIRELSAGLEREQLPSLAALGRWIFDTETGDIEENSAFLAQEDARSLWARLGDQPATCSGAFCAHVDECFSMRARRRARKADLVVVNHALLLSDAAANGVILGKFEHLIVDEAHALEAAARLAFTATLSEARVEQVADTLGPGRSSRRHGWFDRLSLPPSGETWREAVEASRLVSALVGRAVRAVGLSLPQERRGALPAPPPGTAELGALRAGLRQWELVVEEAIEELKEDPELAREGEAGRSAVGELVRVCDLIAAPVGDNAVHWYERDLGRLALHVTPLDVAPILASRLYGHLASLVLTSATLSIDRDFSYLEQSLGLSAAFPRVRSAVVESPFRYEDLMRILLPGDLPPVNAPDGAYAAGLAELLVTLHEALDRNGLVLFTSYELLHDVHARIRDRVPTLAQGVDGSRTSLLERFRREEQGCVLLGTDSFWEGVDLPGEELEYVVVTRLPFAVPTDPVFAALCAEREKSGRDAFLDVALPQAVLRLRQGVGRLVRTASDRGVVVLTDDRIRTKGYGRLFAASLPVKVEGVGRAAVAREAALWFAPATRRRGLN